MQMLPKNLSEIFKLMKDSKSETFILKGIYQDNFESMLSEHLNSVYDLQNISPSKFYCYSKNYKILITIECKHSFEEGHTVVTVNNVWRDEEVLKSLLDSRGMSNYEITNKIGARTTSKELQLVQVHEDRHLFDQDEFQAIGYYIVFYRK